MSSLSNALLDDMDKLDAKLDALCKAPMKTAQQHFNTAMNALYSSNSKSLCDEYFNLSYQKAQEGFHSVQDATDKIICGRIAMLAAIFAFRDNIALLLNEIRLRFLDIVSDYNVQTVLKSYREMKRPHGNIKKLWTSKQKQQEYRRIVFDVVELYHLLTTELSSSLNLMLTHHQHQHQVKRIELHAASTHE
eukprot:CAMPEP_0202714536 /NCGR_PEP_ID=MMETSP1385-20130828/75336_1 /ASSEMBLY_ACC=CAM_ASM_000861 /TAXON_ID=933848 /ORGANISM="Elphidium margaritaceum" /LENGTH=190 /DNA_ID=CAMNT_0049375377 /DNA_START=75 /DNA_END=644 /DNA_ORIENTATION=+